MKTLVVLIIVFFASVAFAFDCPKCSKELMTAGNTGFCVSCEMKYYLDDLKGAKKWGLTLDGGIPIQKIREQSLEIKEEQDRKGELEYSEATSKEVADRIKKAEEWAEIYKKEKEENERKARNENISIVVKYFVIGVLLAVFFFIPSIIGRNKRNSTAIGFLNGSLLFLFIGGAVAGYFLLAPLFQGIAFFGLCGFSLISWIFTLVWALCKD